MGTPSTTEGTWCIGVFEFDAQSMELRRSGVLSIFRERSSRILLYLLEHASQLITREELRHCLRVLPLLLSISVFAQQQASITGWIERRNFGFYRRNSSRCHRHPRRTSGK